MTTTKASPKSVWSEEAIALLRKLWGDGLSASQIATKLGGGLTRNAVIGKVHRLKIPPRPGTHVFSPKGPRPSVPRKPKPSRPPKEAKVARLSVSFPEAKPVLPDAWSAGPASAPTTLEFADGCLWPVGDDGLFCNARVEKKSRYCEHHAVKATRPNLKAA